MFACFVRLTSKHVAFLVLHLEHSNVMSGWCPWERGEMCLKCITLIRCLVEATCWCVCFCQSPAASGYGTQSVRLGKDAIKDFDCCCLSLQPCRDPVVTWVHTLWYDEVPENAKNFFQPVTSQPLTLSQSQIDCWMTDLEMNNVNLTTSSSASCQKVTTIFPILFCPWIPNQ